MNLAQYRQSVAYKMNFASTGTDLTMIDQWVNEAYVDILLRTQCKVSHGQVTTTVGEWRYDLPTAAMDILEVWFEDSGGERQDFQRTDSREIIRLQGGGTVDTNSPPRYFSVDGSNFFLVWPTPTTVDTINLLYIPRPTALSATGDSPSYIPTEHHKALEWYTLWQAADADDDASSGNGEYYRTLYEGRDGYGGILDRIRKHNLRRGGRRLSPVVLPRSVGPTSRSADVRW